MGAQVGVLTWLTARTPGTPAAEPVRIQNGICKAAGSLYASPGLGGNE